MGEEESSAPYVPVEGVSLEQYTKAAVAVFGLGEADAEAAAQAHGIPPGRMQAIGEEWSRRMTAHPEMVQRYNTLYQETMREADVVAPDITLEQYADILRRGRETPLEELLPEFGLNLQTWALVSGSWGERLMADTSLAARLAELLGGPVTG
jgi:hypothetical protein